MNENTLQILIAEVEKRRLRWKEINRELDALNEQSGLYPDLHRRRHELVGEMTTQGQLGLPVVSSPEQRLKLEQFFNQRISHILLPLKKNPLSKNGLRMESCGAYIYFADEIWLEFKFSCTYHLQFSKESLLALLPLPVPGENPYFNAIIKRARDAFDTRVTELNVRKALYDALELTEGVVSGIYCSVSIGVGWNITWDLAFPNFICEIKM